MALRDVSLELLWDVKTFFATTALPRFFQFPFLRSAAVFTPFVDLHVAMEGAGGQEPSAAHRALVGFVGGVGFHVDFEVIAAGERGVTFATVVFLVTGVQLHVPVPTALVLEEAAAEGTAEGEFVAVTLLVTFEKA